MNSHFIDCFYKTYQNNITEEKTQARSSENDQITLTNDTLDSESKRILAPGTDHGDAATINQTLIRDGTANKFNLGTDSFEFMQPDSKTGTAKRRRIEYVAAGKSPADAVNMSRIINLERYKDKIEIWNAKNHRIASVGAGMHNNETVRIMHSDRNKWYALEIVKPGRAVGEVLTYEQSLVLDSD